MDERSRFSSSLTRYFSTRLSFVLCSRRWPLTHLAYFRPLQRDVSHAGSGSGSGSSGCASSTLGTLPLNRCYSSLPRGALAAYGSLTRPATLPRLPLGLGLGPAPGTGNGPLPQNDRDRDSNSSSKRNSDSVLCHRLPLLHPLPTCDIASHQGTGFHEIFNAIRSVAVSNVSVYF